MNATTAPKPTIRRSTQQIFLDEIQSAVENGYPELQIAFDHTASNQLVITLYDSLDPVFAFRCNFQSDYARFETFADKPQYAGWGNGMDSTPRIAYNQVAEWIERAVN